MPRSPEPMKLGDGQMSRFIGWVGGTPYHANLCSLSHQRIRARKPTTIQEYSDLRRQTLLFVLSSAMPCQLCLLGEQRTGVGDLCGAASNPLRPISNSFLRGPLSIAELPRWLARVNEALTQVGLDAVRCCGQRGRPWGTEKLGQIDRAKAQFEVHNASTRTSKTPKSSLIPDKEA